MKPDHHILTTASLLEEYIFWQHWCQRGPLGPWTVTAGASRGGATSMQAEGHSSLWMPRCFSTGWQATGVWKSMMYWHLLGSFTPHSAVSVPHVSVTVVLREPPCQQGSPFSYTIWLYGFFGVPAHIPHLLRDTQQEHRVRFYFQEVETKYFISSWAQKKFVWLLNNTKTWQHVQPGTMLNNGGELLISQS